MSSTDSDELGKVVDMPLERVVGMARNEWTASIGIDGRHDPEHALKRDKAGRKLEELFERLFTSTPDLRSAVEKLPAMIYDGLPLVVEEPEFRPSVKTIVKQLDRWEILDPIPETAGVIYKTIYGRLSADVHVSPDRTDIGKRIEAEIPEVFQTELLPDTLREYVELLHDVMDLAVVVELNVMRDFVAKYKEVRVNLEGRLQVLDQLGLRYSLQRAKWFLGQAKESEDS